MDVQDADVEIGILDKSTATFTAVSAKGSASPNAVRVTAQQTRSRGNPLPLFLGPILGTSNADVRVSAIASTTIRHDSILGFISASTAIIVVAVTSLVCWPRPVQDSASPH